MNQSLVSDRNPLVSVILILLTVLIGFTFLGPMIGLGVASLFYEGNLLVDLQSTTPDPSIFLPLMITQGIAALIGLIIAPWIYLKFIEHKSLEPFFKEERDLVKIAALVLVACVSFMIVLSPVVEWNMHLSFPDFLKPFEEWARAQEDKLMEMTKLLTTFDVSWKFLLGLLVIGIIPGIGEELVFRGLIQNQLWRATKNVHVAIWISAILFSAIHMQFFGFVPRVLLGALFGYLYYWSGNLMIPMLAHFFHNGFTVTMIYLYQSELVGINIDSEESAPLPFVGMAAMFTFAVLYYIRKHYLSEQPSA